MTQQPPMPPMYAPPPPQPPSEAGRPKWYRRPWVIPLAVSLVTLFVGIGIGASGSGTKTVDHTVTKRVYQTVTPDPVQVTTTAIQRVTKTLHPTATVTNTVTFTPKPKVGIPGDGIWLVGTDIEPGTYRIVGHSECYWARLSNTSGGFNSIIANNNGGNQVVTIESSDRAFESQRCGAWTKVQ